MKKPRSVGRAAIFSMEMPNATLVRQGLENFGAAIPEIGRKRMFAFANKVKGRYAYTKDNPEAHGKYVRTFAMRKSRKVLKEELGYVFVMDPVNPKGGRYASYVVGSMAPNSQARQHKPFWTPLRQVVQEEAVQLPSEVIKELGLALMKETSKANIK
jgi:hypothetical protein